MDKDPLHDCPIPNCNICFQVVDEEVEEPHLLIRLLQANNGLIQDFHYENIIITPKMCSMLILLLQYQTYNDRKLFL